MSQQLPALQKQGVPWDKRRHELIQILQDHIYGRTPTSITLTSFSTIEEEPAFAGRATVKTILLNFNNNAFSLKFRLVEPNASNGKTILHLAFSDSIVDEYSPMEEIIDSGFNVAYLYYEDISNDKDDFQSGIAPLLFECKKENERPINAPGKISLWAFASSRVIDVLFELGLKDIYMIGHSRLGKTALWCAAQDERIKGVMSNESGCGGAAISRNKIGERVKDITSMFPFWFCRKYAEYADRENEMPFDQHFLAALIAPRKLLISSAAEDLWADPEAEYRCYLEAERIYKELGVDESISYYKRNGTHFLSRYDWNKFMEFIK